MRNFKKIEVCCGADCVKNGAYEVLQTVEAHYASVTSPCGCIDVCDKAVNVIVDEKEIFSYSTPVNIIEKIENGTGDEYKPFNSEELHLNNDFLGDL